MKTSLVLYLAVIGLLATGTPVSANCPDAKGLTYIIKEDENTGYYKVGGTADSVATRIKALQTGNPRQLFKASEFSVSSCSKAEAAAKKKAEMSSGTTRVKIGVRDTEWFHVTNYNEFYNAVKSAAEEFKPHGQEVSMKMITSLRELLKTLLD